MSSVPPSGYIKLSRKQFEGGDLFWDDGTPFDSRSAWTDLIQLAAWRPYKYRGVDALERGEFVASVRFLADRWKWTKSTVSRWLARAQKAGRITGRRMGHHGMIYLLVNYDTYQGVEPERGTRRGTPDGTQAGQERDRSGTNEKAVKTTKHTTTLSGDADVTAVLEHYVARHPTRRPGAKDARLVSRALGWGYSAAELCDAIDGNATDEWHAERRKHELAYVLRDNGKIDDFRARAEASRGESVVDPITGLPNERGLKILSGGRAA